MSWLIRRQSPFLRSILNEANHQRRHEHLQAANVDQINAVSELVMNTLKGNVPVSPTTMKKLRPHSTTLHDMVRRKNSLKKRRQIMMDQTGRGLWQGMNTVCETCLRQLRYKRKRTSSLLHFLPWTTVGMTDTRCLFVPCTTR